MRTKLVRTIAFLIWILGFTFFIIQGFLPYWAEPIVLTTTIGMVCSSFIIVSNHPKGFSYTHNGIVAVIILIAIPSIFFFRSIPGSFLSSFNTAIFGSVVSYLIFLLLYVVIYSVYCLIIKGKNAYQSKASK